MEKYQQKSILSDQKLVVERLKATYMNHRIGHAYIFDGERGTGKEEIALFFSKLLLCQQVVDNVPCETCHSCIRINSKNHPNLTMIYPDGQTIKKGQMDEFLAEMTKKGFESGRKIYIISQSERMNQASANALLKYLEEPDGPVTAILLTESYSSLLPTIQSRCQRISLQPVTREKRIKVLEEKEVTTSMAATVTMLSANIDEAFELAQAEEFAQKRKTVLKLVEALDQNVYEALLYIQSSWLQVFKEKDDVDQGLDLLLYAYRDIVSLKANLASTLTYPDERSSFESMSMSMTYDQLTNIIEAILEAKSKLKGNMNRQLLMEQLMLTMQEGFLVV